MKSESMFKNYQEFYHFYLSEHSNSTCRNLHYIGNSLVLIILIYSIFASHLILLWTIPIIGYGFAWTGHFFFEHNKPASFKWPIWSFVSDWVMLFQFITGTLKKEHFK
jgi:hypothetical protein